MNTQCTNSEEKKSQIACKIHLTTTGNQHRIVTPIDPITGIARM